MHLNINLASKDDELLLQNLTQKNLLNIKQLHINLIMLVQLGYYHLGDKKTENQTNKFTF